MFFVLWMERGVWFGLALFQFSFLAMIRFLWEWFSVVSYRLSVDAVDEV